MKKTIKAPVKAQDKIDPKVLTVTLIVGIIEFELLYFIGPIVKIAGQDAWLSVMLGGVLVLISTVLLLKLALRFPGQNYFHYLPIVWGRPLGFLISCSYLVYWFLTCLLFVLEFGYANRLLFLPETPVLVPMLAFLIPVVPIALYGWASLVRSFQLLFPFMILPLLLTIVLGLSKVELNRFLPVMENGVLPILKGTVYFTGVFQGLIGILLFLTPFLSEPQKGLKPALAGVATIITVGFLLAISAIGVLGADLVKISTFPGIDTISAIQFPGFPVERYEMFLTVAWLIGVFSTVCLVVYLISYGIIQIFNLKQRRIVICAVTGLVLAATYLVPDFTYAIKMRFYITIISVAFLHIIPAVTLLVAHLRGKRGIT